MLPFFVLAAAVMFFILWKSGILDELKAGGFRRGGEGGLPPDDLDPLPPDSVTSRRLKVFENFIEGLSEDDDSSEADSEE